CGDGEPSHGLLHTRTMAEPWRKACTKAKGAYLRPAPGQGVARSRFGRSARALGVIAPRGECRFSDGATRRSCLVFGFFAVFCRARPRGESARGAGSRARMGGVLVQVALEQRNATEV